MVVFLLLFFGVLQGHDVHDFHLSKTDIHYKTEAKALQLTVHTFIDDMELALKSYEELDYDLLQDSEHEKTDSILYKYFQDHLILLTDGQQVQFTFIGKEVSDDLVGLWAYLEVENLDFFQSIDVTNSILMDTYDDQKNIINIKVDSQSKAFHILSIKDNQKLISL